MYQLLALDLDGTVLSSDHTISPYLRDVLMAAREKCQVMIATGRHHIAARCFYEQLGLTTPAICCNGTYLYDFDQEKVLQENSLAKDDALRFRQLADSLNMKQVLYVTNAMLYSRALPPDYIHDMVNWAASFPAISRPNIVPCASFDDAIQQTDYVWKFVLEGAPEDLTVMTEHPWVQQTFNPEQSWVNRIDFSPIGNSKGNRLQHYIDSMGIQPEAVMAVGDNGNDISMLTLAGHGVAMNHAAERVKACASEICTTDSNGDGLAQLIEQRILN